MNFIRENSRPIALIAPFVAFFALGLLIPVDSADAEAGGIDADRFLILVIGRVLIIGAAIAFFWQTYVADFPIRIDRWGWLVGIVGGILWIAICHLSLERSLVSSFGFSESILGTRSSINPFQDYPKPGTRTLFLIFRFALLVIIVPIAEELFLRGFVMRVVDSDEWLDQPLNQIGKIGLVTGTVYGMLSHPGEFFAAAVWFSLITVLMVRSGKFWNCVLAHAITNLILGVYLCVTGNWHLW